MTTLHATGHAGDPLTLTINGGNGNTDDAAEINLMMRGSSGESTLVLLGWFKRDELMAAIAKADEASQRKLRLVESAA